MAEPGTQQYLYDMRVEALDAEPGEYVDAFAARMVAHSWTIMGTVIGQFNEHELVCRPGMTRQQVMKPWDDAQRASYLNR